MKRALLLVVAAASCAFAQEKGNVIYQTTGAVGTGVSGGFDRASGPVLGAPYSATITNESIQTLADGNRLVQTSTGTTARDSQGRTRQDTVLPPIWKLSPRTGCGPHTRFRQDKSEMIGPLQLLRKSGLRPSLRPLFTASGAIRAWENMLSASRTSCARGRACRCSLCRRISKSWTARSRSSIGRNSSSAGAAPTGAQQVLEWLHSCQRFPACSTPARPDNRLQARRN